MTTSSDPISMRSLAASYTLGLTAGSITNLIVRNQYTDVKQEFICSLGAGIGALAIGVIWNYAYTKDNTESSPTETISKNAKLSSIQIFSLGAFSGVNLFGNKLPISFLNGFCTAGLALAAREKEKQGNLDWKDFV